MSDMVGNVGYMFIGIGTGIYMCLAAAVCAFFACTSVQPPKRQRVVRNMLTGELRCLLPGRRLVMPWEETVPLTLPIGHHAKLTVDTAPAVVRYEPATVRALSKDYVAVNIEVFIDYALGDPLKVADGDCDGLGAHLDDMVRERIVGVVGQLDHSEMTGARIRDGFEMTGCKPMSVRVEHAAVRRVYFDAETTALLRAQSLARAAGIPIVPDHGRAYIGVLH